MAAAPFDTLETRDPASRELALFNMLPSLITRAKEVAPGWAKHLHEIDASKVTSRNALALLPVLRKSDLKAAQSDSPPFGGFASTEGGMAGRIFVSPGPIFEPEGFAPDWWRSARALHAAGFTKADIVHNTFAYHLTPGGWIMDAGARALGCTVIPAGPGNTEQQLEAIAHLKPTAYTGVPAGLSQNPARQGQGSRPRRILVQARVRFRRRAVPFAEAGISGSRHHLHAGLCHC